jgi:hypothetical protein
VDKHAEVQNLALAEDTCGIAAVNGWPGNHPAAAAAEPVTKSFRSVW